MCESDHKGNELVYVWVRLGWAEIDNDTVCRWRDSIYHDDDDESVFLTVKM